AQMTPIVLVTGGCGFIGSHFVRLLLRHRPGWRVMNLDHLTYAGNLANLRDVEGHPDYTFVHGDIADAGLLDRIIGASGPRAVVNFAAESLPPLLRNPLAGEPLPVYGDRAQVRDWLYGEGNCDALLPILDRAEPGRIYNLRTGERRNNLEVVRATCQTVAAEAGLRA